MRSFLAVGAVLLVAVGAPAAAQAAKANAAGGVPALDAALAAETTARVNADATELANRTNADAALQEQITQIQGALANPQAAKAAIGTARIDPIAEFPVYAFAVGMQMVIATGGGGGGAGKAQFDDATFTKLPDASTGELAETLVTGRHVQRAIFTMPAKDAQGRPPPKPYREITLEDLLFTKGDLGAFEALESWSVNYGRIRIRFFPATGSPVDFCFDVKANRSC